jgi:hypothetical protein
MWGEAVVMRWSAMHRAWRRALARLRESDEADRLGRVALFVLVMNQARQQGLFFVRHGVGSEAWSDDGFTPRNERA